MHRSLILTLTMIIATAFMFSESRAITPPCDYLEAVEICDKTDLRPIEGLWSYPEDDVTVMVIRNSERKGVYDIFVVESADCSLKAGQTLGEIRESADPQKFTLKLFTTVKNGVLSMPCEAVATYSDAKESLTVKKQSASFRINPTRLLPSFWRIVSISLKSKETAPEGMIKIYPSYDGNNSTKRGPRYL